MKRRDLLKAAAFGGLVGSGARRAGAQAAQAQQSHQIPPSDRIRVGMIGVGGFGFGTNLPDFMKNPDVDIVAICDVSEPNLDRAVALAGGKAAGVTRLPPAARGPRASTRSSSPRPSTGTRSWHRRVRGRQGRLRREAVRRITSATAARWSMPRAATTASCRSAPSSVRARTSSARSSTSRRDASGMSTTRPAGITRRDRRRRTGQGRTARRAGLGSVARARAAAARTTKSGASAAEATGISGAGTSPSGARTLPTSCSGR